MNQRDLRGPVPASRGSAVEKAVAVAPAVYGNFRLPLYCLYTPAPVSAGRGSVAKGLPLPLLLPLLSANC